MIDDRSSNGKFINFQKKLSIYEFFAFLLNGLYFHDDWSSIIKWKIYQFSEKTFDRRILRFSSQYFSCKLPCNWNLTVDDRSSISNREFINFQRKSFWSTNFSFKRVIFFTRSIIDHHGELGEFINFQTKTLSIHEFFAFPLNISHANCHAIRIWRLIDHRFQTKNL